MKVELIQATKNAGKLIADIASICYGKDEAEDPRKLLEHIYNNGHHSVLEHVYYTFKIEEISRTCLAQLTRHRLASFTVESQRYTKNEGRAIIPPRIRADKKLLSKYRTHMQKSKDFYDLLLSCNVKKEDARFALPQAIMTNLYLSCNLREFLHINKLRTSKGAQWEIRELVTKMTGLVIGYSPELRFMILG